MVAVTSNSFTSSQQLDLLEFLEVGLIVTNTQLEIKMWNGFMTNHTGIQAEDAIDQLLFSICPDIPEEYLRRKIQSVITLQSDLTVTWEQRSSLIKMNTAFTHSELN